MRELIMTFAPVAKSTPLRMVLAPATEHDLGAHQMGVISAYLNRELKEEIYAKTPPVFGIPNAWC